MRSVLLLCSLLLFPAARGEAAVLPDLELGLNRGLEFHNATQKLHWSGRIGSDSLLITLDSHWRRGFRAHNRDSRRLGQQLELAWSRPLDGRADSRRRWLLEGGEQVYVEEYTGGRLRRRSLKADIGAGATLPLPALKGRLSLLAGGASDFRAGIRDAGPRGVARLASRGSAAGNSWQASIRGEALNLDDRRQRHVELGSSWQTRFEGQTSNRLELAYTSDWQDFYLDERAGLLEARSESGLRLANHLSSDFAAMGRSRLRFEAWNLKVQRDPWRRDSLALSAATSGTARSSRYRDLGVEGSLEHLLQLGRLQAEGQIALSRQRLDSRYRTLGAIGENNLSRVQSNRLQLRFWSDLPRDSLFLVPRLEMRRRDAEVDREGLARDRQDQDRLSLLVEGGWRHRLRSWADLDLSLLLSRQGENHLQADRSAGNHELRRLQVAVGHVLRPAPGLLLEGEARTGVTFRLYEYESAQDPRSTIQRRWQWDEHLRWQAPGLLSPWLAVLRGEEWRIRSRWLEEDGGRFDRRDELELLSDSARELEFRLAWRLCHARGWIAPGLRWLNRRDYQWESKAGSRARSLERELYRRGPDLEIRWLHGSLEAGGFLYYEQVDLGSRPSWNLWGELSLVWRPGGKS